VNRTLTKKLIYVIAVLAILAMMIPAMDVPVRASNGGSLSMVLVDPTTNTPGTTEGDPGWNVTGSTVQITANLNPGYSITAWNLINVVTEPISGAGPATWVGTQPAPGTNPVYITGVTGVWGDAIIQALVTSASGNDTLQIEKKWGQIANTQLTNPGFSQVFWIEANKAWSGNTTITDTVNGTFTDGAHVAQGAILNWYLVEGNVTVDMTARQAPDLKTYVSGLATPLNVVFDATGNTGYVNVTGTDGANTAQIDATGANTVQIVVVPEYPGDPSGNSFNVTPEVTTWSFYKGVATATGTGPASFSTSDGVIQNLTAVPLPAILPTGMSINDFPYGLFLFTITGVGNGGTANITINLPAIPLSTSPLVNQYWKYHLNALNLGYPWWVQVPLSYPSNLQITGSNASGYVITFTLQDGGPYDADASLNGTIVDPGGPAFGVTYDSLSNLVQQFVSNQGIRNSLLAKLDAAKAAAAGGNTQAKDGQILAFINEVEAQSGKAISVENAATLIASAKALDQ
jgi:hypothetical protein